MSPIHILLGLGALALLVLSLRKKKEPEPEYGDVPPDGSAPPPDIDGRLPPPLPGGGGGGIEQEERPPHDLRQTWEHLTETGRQAALTTPANRKADLPYIEALTLAARDKMDSGQFPYQMQQTLQDGSWSIGLLNLVTTNVKRDRTPEEDVSDVFVKWRAQGMPTIGHSPVQRGQSIALTAAGKAAAQATPATRKADLTTITKLVQVGRSYTHNQFFGGNRTAPTEGLAEHFTKQGYSGAIAGIVERNITLGRIIKDDVNAAIVDWLKAGMPSVGTPIQTTYTYDGVVYSAPFLVLPDDIIVHAPLVSPTPGAGGGSAAPVITGDPIVDKAIADAGGAATEEGKKLLEGVKLPDLSGGGPRVPPEKQTESQALANLAAQVHQLMWGAGSPYRNFLRDIPTRTNAVRKALEKGATSTVLDLVFASSESGRDLVTNVNAARAAWIAAGMPQVRL